MNEEEPPDLTVNVYRTRINPRQYFPVKIGNNGTIDEKLSKFSNTADIFGTYKVGAKYENDFFELCKNSFGKQKIIVKKRIEELLMQK